MARRKRGIVVLVVSLMALAALTIQLNRTQLWEDGQVHAGWRVQHHVLLEPLPPYAWIGGPSAVEIAEGPPFASLPADVEVAVIAGGTVDGRGFNPLLSGNNDGVVMVTETELSGARDRMTVNTIHTVIAAAPETIAATLKFLASGRLR